MTNFLDEVVQDSKDKASEIPTQDKLNVLANLCEDQMSIEDRIADLDRQMSEAKSDLKIVSEFKIPELMNEIGISEFKLGNGLKVSVKPYFSGKITDENADDAYSWLEEHDFGDIIKAELKVIYRRHQDVKIIRELAESLGFMTQEKAGIHYQTLCAFIKEQITAGHEIPRDLLGVYEGFRTKIGR